MTKKLALSLILITLLVVSMVSADDYTPAADRLNGLGLFKGGSNGYELERAPNRVEGAVMLVRLLGKEQVANDNMYPHPFKDVPTWANAHVGYMYHMNLTKGVSATQFDAYSQMNGNTYATFVLRALGYDDKAGDFKWDQSLQTAQAKGIITAAEQSAMTSVFNRNEMVGLSSKALDAKVKSGATTLLSTLVQSGAVDASVVEETKPDYSLVSAQLENIDQTKDSFLVKHDFFTMWLKKNEVNDPRIISTQYVERQKTEGYQGNISIKSELINRNPDILAAWNQKYLHFSIEIYNKGQLIKTGTMYTYYDKDIYTTNQQFGVSLTHETFDKAIVSVKAYSLEDFIGQYTYEVEGVSITDTEKIKSEIRAYNRFAVSNYEYVRQSGLTDDQIAKVDTKIFSNFSKFTYPNGDAHLMYAGFFELDPAIDYQLKVEGDGSGVGTDGNANFIFLPLKSNNPNKKSYIYLKNADGSVGKILYYK